MSREGGASKVGFAPGYGEGSSLEGTANPFRPSLALSVGETVPPVQGRLRLGFGCEKGRRVIIPLLAAAYNAMAFVLSGSVCRVVRVLPAPAEGDGMD